MNILLVGNHPMDMSTIYDNLASYKKAQLNTDILFDIKEIFARIAKIKPAGILLDDRLGAKELVSVTRQLFRNTSTQDIPVTLIKNSNFNELTSMKVDDYVMRNDVSGDKIYRSFKNSRRFRRTSLFLFKTYRKRKSQFANLVDDIKERVTY